ncbi:hypothetical protein [Endozoicomonas numazuensis]|uniref:Uncharacterized protein n=1 Tax=Endozoicomonas numazuensis TaxID=1137799 RepID=A0A081NGK9_9GAMM|nr:hypothetical protein [Endozoicomonas numazuensis]KEQ17582.1 hypothetical protein GZ78_17775 [Endozoicomonas numazuensis]
MMSVAKIAFLSLFFIVPYLKAEEKTAWYWQSFDPENSLDSSRDVIDDFSSLVCRTRVEDGSWLAGMLNKDGSQCITLEDGSGHDHFQLPMGEGFKGFEWQSQTPTYPVNAMRASSEPNNTQLYELNHQTQVWCQFQVNSLLIPGVLLKVEQAILCQGLNQQSSEHYQIATYQHKAEWPELIPYMVMISSAGFVIFMAKYIR